jgi:hypothetical protein
MTDMTPQYVRVAIVWIVTLVSLYLVQRFFAG